MTGVLVDTWHLFAKHLRITWRTPIWALFNVIQPLIWLLIFGQLFRSMAQLPGFPAARYMDFFLPGALIMTVLFGSFWAGVSLLREINWGTVDKMLVTPVSRGAIVFSRVLHAAATVLIQCLLILGAGLLVGARMGWDPLGLLLAFGVLLLLGMGFAALSNGLAMALQREEPLVVMGNLMTLPLMFFSSAMVPQAFMPHWIQTLATVNPVEYAVRVVRIGLGGDLAGSTILPALGFLLAFALLATVWATEMFANRGD